MQTDLPTVEFFFGLTFTYYKLRVYKTEEAFARKLLEARRVVWLSENGDSYWQEIDTRELLAFVHETLPTLIGEALPRADEIAQKVCSKGRS